MKRNKFEHTLICVSIPKLRSDLSGYVGKVRRGSEITIVDHGKPVARSIKTYPLLGEEEDWGNLATDGLIELPRKSLSAHKELPLPLSGEKASQIIIDERR